MRIIFFGTPPFSAEILKFLLANSIEIVAVVTQPDRPKGRSKEPMPSAVKSLIMQSAPHIHIYQPEKASSKEFEEILRSYQADLFVVVAFGQILKQNILDLPSMGCINVHPSLLPKYRGAAPIQRSLINGEKVSGVTIMRMILAMDAGDILKTISFSIPEEMNYGELEEALCAISKPILLETLKEISENREKATPQDSTLVTFAPKIELCDIQIDWGKSAVEIHNLVRGTSPEPGAWCIILIRGERKRLRILKTRCMDVRGIPGEKVQCGPKLIIACGKEGLEILELQLEGKRKMNGLDFIRGISPEQLSFQLEKC